MPHATYIYIRMSIANLFRLGRLWIEHFGQLTSRNNYINIIMYHTKINNSKHMHQLLTDLQ